LVGGSFVLGFHLACRLVVYRGARGQSQAMPQAMPQSASIRRPGAGRKTEKEWVEEQIRLKEENDGAS
jgi:hypothetical protein